MDPSIERRWDERFTSPSDSNEVSSNPPTPQPPRPSAKVTFAYSIVTGLARVRSEARALTPARMRNKLASSTPDVPLVTVEHGWSLPLAHFIDPTTDAQSRAHLQALSHAAKLLPPDKAPDSPSYTWHRAGKALSRACVDLLRLLCKGQFCDDSPPEFPTLASLAAQSLAPTLDALLAEYAITMSDALPHAKAKRRDAQRRRDLIWDGSLMAFLCAIPRNSIPRMVPRIAIDCLRREAESSDRLKWWVAHGGVGHRIMQHLATATGALPEATYLASYITHLHLREDLQHAAPRSALRTRRSFGLTNLSSVGYLWTEDSVMAFEEYPLRFALMQVQAREIAFGVWRSVVGHVRMVSAASEDKSDAVDWHQIFDVARPFLMHPAFDSREDSYVCSPEEALLPFDLAIALIKYALRKTTMSSLSVRRLHATLVTTLANFIRSIVSTAWSGVRVALRWDAVDFEDTSSTSSADSLYRREDTPRISEAAPHPMRREASRQASVAQGQLASMATLIAELVLLSGSQGAEPLQHAGMAPFALFLASASLALSTATQQEESTERMGARGGLEPQLRDLSAYVFGQPMFGRSCEECRSCRQAAHIPFSQHRLSNQFARDSGCADAVNASKMQDNSLTCHPVAAAEWANGAPSEDDGELSPSGDCDVHADSDIHAHLCDVGNDHAGLISVIRSMQAVENVPLESADTMRDEDSTSPVDREDSDESRSLSSDSSHSSCSIHRPHPAAIQPCPNRSSHVGLCCVFAQSRWLFNKEVDGTRSHGVSQAFGTTASRIMLAQMLSLHGLAQTEAQALAGALEVHEVDYCSGDMEQDEDDAAWLADALVALKNHAEQRAVLDLTKRARLSTSSSLCVLSDVRSTSPPLSPTSELRRTLQASKHGDRAIRHRAISMLREASLEIDGDVLEVETDDDEMWAIIVDGILEGLPATGVRSISSPTAPIPTPASQRAHWVYEELVDSWVLASSRAKSRTQTSPRDIQRDDKQAESSQAPLRRLRARMRRSPNASMSEAESTSSEKRISSADSSESDEAGISDSDSHLPEPRNAGGPAYRPTRSRGAAPFLSTSSSSLFHSSSSRCRRKASSSSTIATSPALASTNAIGPSSSYPATTPLRARSSMRRRFSPRVQHLQRRVKADGSDSDEVSGTETSRKRSESHAPEEQDEMDLFSQRTPAAPRRVRAPERFIVQHQPRSSRSPSRPLAESSSSHRQTAFGHIVMKRTASQASLRLVADAEYDADVSHPSTSRLGRAMSRDRFISSQEGRPRSSADRYEELKTREALEGEMELRRQRRREQLRRGNA